ncbi:LysR family transcriptional regulator [Herbaspirillum seropedicae]|uniref:LysR family transcription regulator protein n=1 Tax=Herbaspirillum seropedicae (strain SmR1) TaxID=757424 RepID=D8IUQ4_HERSS|nr:LysR family transcriptional regulator [Herbaspirillum seropedicae]ADJ65786.1 LysR family transcription regulator protein [Herbaspirillum seropedicae SmR1]AKN67585.1 transcriptional regulator [Herbaspirillum seropedicae]NQE29633.1 transcriptional regulator [Herbaspirillum seropedicae]QDD66544.1 LysR family transcriptional regulator [Herbaspirillum seropedicae]UMU23601.1 LysR family transcriptional regulator [Herbaspirillum seropedicae]
MKITLRQLQIFLAVAQSGSTTAAADLVALSQSAASAALNELEHLLGVQLFDRVGKRLVLNDSGRQLLPQARHMLDAAQTIERQFSDPEAGSELHIGASTTIGSYMLPAMIAAYRKDHAGARVRALVANTADIVDAVVNFEVDAGLIEGPCHADDVEVEPWMMDELIVVAAPRHPLVKSGRKITLKRLREAEWLLREAGSGTREAVEHALIPYLHHLPSSFEFGNSEAIKRATAEGLGISCLSRAVVEDMIESRKLVELDTPLPTLRRHFYMVVSRHRAPSPSLGALLGFCRAWAQRQQPG